MVTLALASLAVVLLVVPALGLGGRLLQLITSPGTGPEVSGHLRGRPTARGSRFTPGGSTTPVCTSSPPTGSSWRMTRVGKGTAEWPHPAWSPDGEWLAFVGAGKRGVHVVNGDGGGRRTVARTQADVTGLAWSPDGRKLAFLTSPNAPDGHREASLVNLDGSGRRNLWRDWGLVELPVWSPDGRMIAFTARSGSSTRPSDLRGERRLDRPAEAGAGHLAALVTATGGGSPSKSVPSAERRPPCSDPRREHRRKRPAPHRPGRRRCGLVAGRAADRVHDRRGSVCATPPTSTW